MLPISVAEIILLKGYKDIWRSWTPLSGAGEALYVRPQVQG